MFVKPKLFNLSILLLSALLMTSTTMKLTEASPLARIHVKFSQPPHQIQEHGITTDGGRLISQHSYSEFGRRDEVGSIGFNTGFDPSVVQQRNSYYNPVNPTPVPFNSAPNQPIYDPAIQQRNSFYNPINPAAVPLNSAPIQPSYDPAIQQRNPYYNPINPASAAAVSVPFHSAPTLPQQQQQQQLASYPALANNDISYDTHESGHTSPDFSDGLAYPDPQLLTGDAAAAAVRYIYGRGSGLFFEEVPHTRLVLRNQEERRENKLNGNVLASLRPGSPWLRPN